jgi:hAT family C-terminal dimerisation region
MDILPIQASSVPCERVFLSSKETTTARRNKLHPQLVEALQVLKFGQKNNKLLNFTAGLDKDEEMMDLEAIEEAQPTEDLEALFQSLQY